MAYKRSMRPEKIAEIRALVAAGKTTDQIAAHYGVKRTTALRYRVTAGVGQGGGPRERVDREFVVARTADGWSAAMIARRLGCSTRAVQRHRSAAGCVNSRPIRPFTAAEETLARQLLADGASFREVANTLGRNSKTVTAKFKGLSQWTASDGGKMRGWQKTMAKRHGEAFIKLIQEVA